MKTALIFGVLLAIVATAFSHPTSKYDLNLDEEWESFKEIYGRNYFDEEIESTRKAIFAENLEKVYRHNLQYHNGLVTFKLAINKFSDKETDEMMPNSRISQMENKQNNKEEGEGVFIPPLHMGELPTNVDWSKTHLVSPVKNQKKCGSCWVFSGIGAIEGQQARMTGKMVELSEQNVIDCAPNDGRSGGCNGGFEHNVFVYAKNNKGVDTEKSYPYEAKENLCRFKEENVGAKVTGFNRIRMGNETEMMIALATVGPLAIAVDARHGLKGYHKGIFRSDDCEKEYYRLSHSLLLAGYGTTEDGDDYWLVKNSWGDDWGENGYFRIARNAGNMCGIASSASYPRLIAE